MCVCGGQAGGVCNGWTVFVAGEQAVSVTTLTRNCVHRSSPNWVVGAGSDHHQLIKFWPSCIPGNGVCSGAKIFGTQCLRLFERFFRTLSVVVTKENRCSVLS